MNHLRIPVVLMALVLSIPAAVLGQSNSKPNFILIMCDDLGWGDLKFNNDKSKINTPHLDEMAANSIRFTRFYSAAPVCSPTRGSCLTGRHPYRYGIVGANRGHMKPNEITIAEFLQKQGYATGHFGKWHLGTLTKSIKDSNRGGPKNIQHFSPPSKNGFDVNFSTEAKVPTYDPMIKPEKGGKTGWDAIKDKSTAVSYGTRYWNEKNEIVADNLDGDNSRIIMDRAVEFIRKRSEQRENFLAVIWFHSPHLPVVAGPEAIRPYSDLGVHHRNYFGCVTAMDQQIGRLRKQLRELKIADDTMIFFCSDNGPEGKSNSPGSAGILRGRKRSLYEGGVRVPALIEWPAKIGKANSTDFPAVTSDYLPTILDVLKLEMPDARPIDGVSLMPAIGMEKKIRNAPIGFQAGGQKTWVEDRYKAYQDKNGEWELYDIISNPTESKNLAGTMPDQLKTMVSEFEKWSASCKKSARGEDYK